MAAVPPARGHRSALYQERTRHRAGRPRHRGDAAAGAARTAPTLRGSARVTALATAAHGGSRCVTAATTYRVAARVVVCADAWTVAAARAARRRPAAHRDRRSRSPTSAADPGAFAPGRFPVWIWMDDPSLLRLPAYGEATVKAAQDCGGPEVTGDDRAVRPRPERCWAGSPGSWPACCPEPGRRCARSGACTP